MTDPPETLKPADPNDLAAALAFASGYSGLSAFHNADELMAETVAPRLIEHCRASGPSA